MVSFSICWIYGANTLEEYFPPIQGEYDTYTIWYLNSGDGTWRDWLSGSSVHVTVIGQKSGSIIQIRNTIAGTQYIYGSELITDYYFFADTSTHYGYQRRWNPYRDICEDPENPVGNGWLFCWFRISFNEPSLFKITDLTVEEPLIAGKMSTITATVTNTGAPGTKTIIFKVNDTEIGRQEITLNNNETLQVTQNYTPQNPGQINICAMLA